VKKIKGRSKYKGNTIIDIKLHKPWKNAMSHATYILTIVNLSSSIVDDNENKNYLDSEVLKFF
jgi:hypothetical protein